eukprot:symbB.v1.2.018673.t1/scaffold1455.1/size117749/9
MAKMEEFLQILSGEERHILDIVQAQHDLCTRHVEASFARLAQRGITSDAGASASPVLDEFIPIEGIHKLSRISTPQRPELPDEHVDSWPVASTELEVLSPEVVPTGRDPEKHGTNHSLTRNQKAVSHKMTAETSKLLMQKQAGHKKTWGMEWREKAAAYVDYLAAFLVLLNSAVMMLELELEGRAIGRQLSLTDGPNLEDIEGVFKTLHHSFVFVFLGELIIRTAIRGLDFFRDIANWFDIFLVAAGLLEVFVLGGDPKNLLMMRLMRTLKAFRAIRMVRTFRLFKGLQLLVKACTCFLPSLGWSMVLLGVFMSIGTLVLGNLLQDFIVDDSQNLEDRNWIWNRYGTAYRAMYTLYEVTFAGNWPTNARPVLEKVSQGFVVFFVLYVTIIVFAIIRVISAIFLKDTLDAAQADAESVVVDRLRKKAEYLQKLEVLFTALDEDGGGTISEQKLVALLDNPKVEAYFQTLDVDVTEGAALVNMLDDGDGEVTLDEFVDGILRCRGPARALDQVAMRADLQKLDGKLNTLLQASGVPLQSTKLKH